MRPKHLLTAALTLLMYSTNITAQTDSSISPVNISSEVINKPAKTHAMNFFKVNLLGVVLKNYQVQYERILSRKFSIAIAYRTMPNTTVPFKDLIIKAAGTDDEDTKTTIDKLLIGNYAITPEVRLYLSKKGYGHGFYVAPFFRHAEFKVSNMQFTYQNSSNVDNTIDLTGKLTSNTGGFLLGVQSFIGKHICIDTWILGPHFGNGIGNFSGIPGTPLTPDEQTDLRQQLEDIDIPLTNKTVNVTANSASLKLDGPWGGIRVGLNIGVRF